MFTYLKLKNYKFLINFEVDLTESRNTPKKLVSIYGENGVGKSNFVDSFYTLKKFTNSKIANKNLETLEYKMNSDKKYLDDDTIDIVSQLSDDINQINNYFKNELLFSNSTFIINKCKTNNSTTNMITEVKFKINSKEGIYYLETDDTDIIAEKLKFTLNKNMVNYFEIKKDTVNINESVFIDSEYRKEILTIIEKYWGKHSFLALILYELEDKKEDYVKKRIFNEIFEVINFFSTLKVRSRDEMDNNRENYNENKFFQGVIPIEKEQKLLNIENTFNTFFTSLYSDIKKAYYKKVKEKGKIRYNLYFKKNIYNTLIDVNYRQESTGTKNILRILSYLISAAKGKTVIIDEIDNGIHDLLILKILENLSEDLKGQLIITTHNTLLLEEEFIKDSIYIFKVDENANKKLLALNKFEGRVHPNLSIRKRYLKGLYGGTPFPMDIDFIELIEGV